MKAVRVMVIVVGCGAAAGCGPVYRTTYEMTPPQTAAGRACVSNCQQTKNLCRNTGYDRYRRCKAAQRAYAERKFNEYRIQQLLLKKPIKKSERSFHGGYSCRIEGSYEHSCQQDFVGCFSNCGGQVRPHTVCTANCDKVQPGHQISGGPNTPLPR